jgi:Zn-dependent metalloprotease
MTSRCRCINCIMPPHILKKLIDNPDSKISDAALKTLLATARLRGVRSVQGLAAFAAAAPAGARRTIFDCANGTDFSSATLLRSEDGPSSADATGNRAFDGLGTTREFYKEVLERDSLDGNGMRISGYVHYDSAFNNAFWDGSKMIFGDGDGEMFTDLTKSLDVIAHELTHGVTEFSAGLEYHDQPGALNESISDVFGSLVKQWASKQTAEQADWLIGAGVFTPNIDADALRSMKEPGKAYNNALFGRDPQPDHMSKYVHLPDTELGDHGGVHINSGIPNKAFYLTAIGIGGAAWEAPGHIWYAALKASSETTEFQAFADTTYLQAGQLYGQQSNEQQAVLSAWKEVGIKISGVRSIAVVTGQIKKKQLLTTANGRDHDQDIARKIDELASQLTVLTREVASLQSSKPH